MTFKELVIEYISKIPVGRVSTYGSVAAAIGKPGAARYVGFILAGHTIDEIKVPWWRVVNSKGYLSINHGALGLEKERQRDLLKDEGVAVNGRFMLDLKKYFWSGD